MIRQVKTSGNFEDDEIVFKTRYPFFWTFTFVLSVGFVVAFRYSDHPELVEKSIRYLAPIALFSLFMHTWRTSVGWNKRERRAILKRSLLGLSATESIPFESCELKIGFINLIGPERYSKTVDRDWFVLKIKKREFALTTKL